MFGYYSKWLGRLGGISARGHTIWAFLVAQTVENLPAMRETWVQPLGQEDPLEKRMATHSSILAWRIPWTEEPGGSQFMGSQRVEYDWVTNTFTRGHLIKPTTPSPHLGNFSVWLMVHTPPFSLHIPLSRCLRKGNSENCLKLFRAP